MALCGEATEPDPATLTRSILENLALKYRYVLDLIEPVIGRRISKIAVVGGGARNTLLCEFTAAATGLPVHAGPVEATALGILALQLIAKGELSSIDEARILIRRLEPIQIFEPVDGDSWNVAYDRFRRVVHATSV